MKKFIVGVAVLLLLGCSKPQDKVIPNNPDQWETEIAKEVKQLSEQDRKLLAAYMLRKKMGEAFGAGGIPVGTTIGAAIEDEKKFVAAQEAKKAEEEQLKARLLAQQQAFTKQITDAFGLVMLSKKLGKQGFQDYMAVDVGVKNKSNKAMSGFKGTFNVTNSFGDPIINLTIVDEQELAPGAEETRTYGFDYNQFIESNKNFMGGDLAKMKVNFVPEAIHYQDGTQLVIPNQN